jgi:Amt family ammonium transporter
VGALLTGVLATKTWNGATDGLLFGNPKQLLIQAAAVGAAILFSGVGHLRAAQAGLSLRAAAREQP